MIVVWSTKNDSTADRVERTIKDSGFSLIRIDTDNYGELYNISWCTESSTINYKNQKFDINEIRSIYYRRPSISEIPRNERDFAKNETWYFLRALFYKIQNVYWMNHPCSLILAENKLRQLEIAKNIEFDVPPTIIPSNYIEAHSFFLENNRSCICKSGYTGILKKSENETKSVYTWKIPEDANEKYFFEVSNCPTIIQKMVKKVADIRVTVAGDNYFAVRVGSKDLPEIDWRMYIEKGLSYEIISLPIEIWEKIKLIMKQFDITFAAFDFAVTEDDSYFFLEFNPAGQWEWLEVEAGAKISKIIAEELIKRDK